MTLRPLLHLGYIKTGSTFLQRAVFNRPDLGFVLPSGHPRGILAEQIITSDSFSFDPDRARPIFQQAERQSIQQNPGCVPVWSEEVLIGNPLSRRYDGESNSRKLKETFGHAKILIVIREQRSMALSMYKEFIRQGNPNGLDDFIGTGSEPKGFNPILNRWFLEYSNAIEAYYQLFGQSEVLILPYEQLREDPHRFISRIQRHAGAQSKSDAQIDAERRHQSIGSAALGLQRTINRFNVRSPLSPKRSPIHQLAERSARAVSKLLPNSIHKKADQDLRARIDERFSGSYKEDNQKVAELIGVDLSQYGYDI